MDTGNESLVPKEKIIRSEDKSRMEFFSKLHSRLELSITERKGYKNLLAVPKDRPVVIASDHLSDITLETVIGEASPFRKVAAAAQSTHLEIPVGGRFMEWAGNNRLYPVSTNEETKHQRQAQHLYRVEDYEKMVEAMKKGESMVTAAHRPEYSGHLPHHPGLSALTLAHLTGAPIIPATVDIHASPDVIRSLVKDVKGTAKRLIQRNRPQASVSFGQPIELEPIPKEDLQLLERFINIPLRKTLTDEEKDRANAVYQKMMQEGETVMLALSEMLPPEKRGKWGELTPNDQSSSEVKPSTNRY